MRFSQKLVLHYIRTKFRLLSAVSKRAAAKKAFRLFCTPQYRNTKKLPRVFEQSEKLYFPFRNYKISGYRWNTGAGKTALILHGFESSVINFDRYVKPLIRKGYTVLAFDAPAHGRSTGSQINALIYKDFILQICKDYGPVTAFIAHSLGALALSLVLEELPHDERTEVVFIAPATETPTAINTFFKFLWLDEGVRKEFDLIVAEKGGHPPDWFSLRRAAGNIRAKVLFCQDRDDDMTPMTDVQPLIAAGYSNFTFYITEGLGHRRIYRDNKVSRKIIDFFSEGKADVYAAR